MKRPKVWQVLCPLILFVLSISCVGLAQEKKNLRVVFTGLAWNSELPFRVALARGFFKQQWLDNNLIDAKSAVERVVSDKTLKLAHQELRSEGRLKP